MLELEDFNSYKCSQEKGVKEICCGAGSTGCAGTTACGQGQCGPFRAESHPVNDGDATHS